MFPLFTRLDRLFMLFMLLARLALTIPTHGPVELSGQDRRLPAHSPALLEAGAATHLFVLFMLLARLALTAPTHGVR